MHTTWNVMAAYEIFSGELVVVAHVAYTDVLGEVQVVVGLVNQSDNKLRCVLQ